MGLIRIYHANLPVSLWVDAFFIATYLINGLPSTVENMRSPFYMLFKQHPEYNDLRDFGSVFSIP